MKKDNAHLSGNLVSFTSAKKQILDGLVDSLTNRFAEHSKLLKATSLANIKYWPKHLHDDKGNLAAKCSKFTKTLYPQKNSLLTFISDFGKSSLDIIVQHFGPALEAAGVSCSELQPDWIRFKHLVYSRLEILITLLIYLYSLPNT